jgi:hypothetical protein
MAFQTGSTSLIRLTTKYVVQHLRIEFRKRGCSVTSSLSQLAKTYFAIEWLTKSPLISEKTRQHLYVVLAEFDEDIARAIGEHLERHDLPN